MLRPFRTAIGVAGAIVLVCAGAERLDADDPVSSSVRFNREIIRILQRRCLPCHGPGALAMPLVSYRDVREWGRAIREEVVERRMPPNSAAPGYGRLDNPLALTARETSTLLTWLDGGMPRGEERDLPPSLEPATGDTPATPDALRVDLPEQMVPPLEELVVRRITVDTRLAADRLVSRVVVRPGSRGVLRGALVYAGSGEESWVGAWLPWQRTFVAPETHAFVLRKGAALTVVLYYRGGDEAIVDRSAIELHAAPAASRPLSSLRIEATARPAGEAAGPAASLGQLTLETDTTIWALQPVVGATTQTLELRARRPGGATEVLLWMPTVRPEWPHVLVLQQPAVLPAGTTLILSTRRSDPAGAPDRVGLSVWRQGGRPAAAARPASTSATPRRP